MLNSPVCDFLILTTASISLYKLTIGRLQPYLTRRIHFELGHYWFDGTSGCLLCAASPPKLGLLQVFSLHKPSKSIHGPKLSISVEPSVTNQWTVSGPHSAPLKPNTDTRSQVTGLFRIYDLLCFLHLNCKTGLLRLYKITDEAISALDPALNVPPRERYDVLVCDNLLLVMSPAAQETFLFDIKGKNPAFCVIFHNLPQNFPTISVKIEIDRDQKQYFPLVSILYDKMNLNHAKPVESSEFASHFIEAEGKLDGSLVVGAGDILIDMRKGRCYKVLIDPIEVSEAHPDVLDAVLFLLRRVGCKQAAYTCLKSAISHKVPISSLSSLFSTVNGFYKQAARDRRYSESKKPAFRKSMTVSSSRKESSESELKLDSGETVMLQADAVSLVFGPLAGEGESDKDYLMQVIMEYVRSLVECEIQVHGSLQLLLVKVAIKEQAFPLLEALIQGQILSDSRELASMLMAVSSPQAGGQYPALFPLALDMMKRLGLQEDMMDVLLANKMVYEVMMTMVVKDPQDWKRIAAASEDLGDPALKTSVIRRMQG